MKAKELAERLDEIAEEYPDAEVEIDPPDFTVAAAYFRVERDIVELIREETDGPR